ncbi:double-strand break repair helicase AddA [Terrihabitans rhizophilus]|uniref:DNA 3'-5' helicase n=1 Tax=Terrihabitans rhizophilus TaxID=3092662 RepID=A0ABU4RLS1_9HYPH|nr:double-strand break repair helicase AddA [Terrihabitans sp. PJ23]MDX6804615.1 double-strand break repair helicase AddA [Terrihabitans sp. PJ23]
MKPLFASEITKERQLLAADPTASAWVSANAGSGKTTVLSNRVIRLLLSGVEPSRILCLTFTKAAAANMSNRVFSRLSAWATLPDAELDKALDGLGAGPANAVLRARARRLFARALETPGGLKVLTIHAFCERVLHGFPFEARVPASFTVLDDRQREELVAAARAEVLALAADGSSNAVAGALGALLTEAGDGTIDRALGEMLRRGEQVAALMRQDGADTSARTANRIAAALGLMPGETVESINAEIVDEQAAVARWPDLLGWLRSGTANDHKLADCIEEARAAASPHGRRTAYLSLCLTKKLEPRSDKQFVTKKLRDARPDLYEFLLEERERLAALITRRRAAATGERSMALLTIADAVWSRYAVEKARRGALDFTDLITATRALIRDTGAAWVHFKLDQGIDHILVDEAQDTSPEQWEIIAGLAAEFTAGEGARTQSRTVFAVGDEKQSIFSFQGAAPAEFDRWRRTYTQMHVEAGLVFHPLPLTQSFRSASAVLEAVDQTFAAPEAHAGLSSEAVGTAHDTARTGAPGRVEVWPLIEPADKGDEEKPWNAPLDAVAERSPVVQLAGRIAGAVKGWTRGEDVLGPCPAVPEGEILILVRNRGPLFEAVLRELKNADVRVAGADRLVLGGHIAVLDLLALADVLVQPADDLALAGVLKSPLFGFDDDDLMRLAPKRAGGLRSALRNSPEAAFVEADRTLSRWAATAARQRPFDFYAGVLSHGGGRRAFRSRLGAEVDDVLDEFLRLAITYGESETPSLFGFAAWMRAAPAEIKRDLETGGSEVRVMTVHGAKGLEARLVVLADFGCPRQGSKAPVIYGVDEPGRREGEAELLLWSPKKDDDPPPLTAARLAETAEDEGEHRRLLYVALTRAEDRLVIAGHVGQRTKRDGSWYGLVAGALDQPFGTRHHVGAFGGEMVVYSTGDAVQAEASAPAVPLSPDLPVWLRAPARAEAPAAVRLAPSRALPHVPSTPGEAGGMERGRLLHRLLEELPRLPPETRGTAAARYLARRAPGLSAVEQADIAREAVDITLQPHLAALLGPSARAEVPLTGELSRADGTSLLVAGRVDRLLVEEDRVLLVDFKSERAVPARVPDHYVAQLALYGAVLRELFTGRRVECAVLWTSTGELAVVGEAQLNAMLARILALPPLP